MERDDLRQLAFRMRRSALLGFPVHISRRQQSARCSRMLHSALSFRLGSVITEPRVQVACTAKAVQPLVPSLTN